MFTCGDFDDICKKDRHLTRYLYFEGRTFLNFAINKLGNYVYLLQISLIVKKFA